MLRITFYKFTKLVNIQRIHQEKVSKALVYFSGVAHANFKKVLQSNPEE